MYVCGLREKNVGRIISESKSEWFALKLKLLIQTFWQYELEHHNHSCIFTSDNSSTSPPNFVSKAQVEYKLIQLKYPNPSFSLCRKYTCAHLRCGLSVARSVQSWRLGNCEGRFEQFMWIFYFALLCKACGSLCYMGYGSSAQWMVNHRKWEVMDLSFFSSKSSTLRCTEVRFSWVSACFFLHTVMSACLFLHTVMDSDVAIILWCRPCDS